MSSGSLFGLVRNRNGQFGLIASATVIAGSVAGSAFPPDRWYLALRKPFDALATTWYAPVWLLFYLVLAYLVWRAIAWPRHRAAVGLWLIHMLAIVSWEPVFIGAHWIVGGLALLVVADLTGIGFAVLLASRRSRVGMLIVPYLIWLFFLSWINFEIAVLN